MDYRRRWCRLVEFLDPDEDLNFYESSNETTLITGSRSCAVSPSQTWLLVKRTGMIDEGWLT